MTKPFKGVSVYETPHGLKLLGSHEIAVPGYQLVRLWDGPTEERDPMAVEMPKTDGRGVIAKADDDLAGLDIVQLLAIARKLGYEEDPKFPNGGVRVMRCRNFIRNARKKR